MWGGCLYLPNVQTFPFVIKTPREQDSELMLSEVSRPAGFAELSQRPWKTGATVSFKTFSSETSGF